MPWQVAIYNLLDFFSIRFTVALAETPFKKLIVPKQYRQVQNMSRLTEFTWSIMIQHKMRYPENIHLPTGILLKTLVESSIPVIAPNGESKSDSPSVPSVNPNLAFIPGIDATQIPNSRLEVENRKPTANEDLFLRNEVKFLIMNDGKN
jgi:hypothetical protein